MVLTTIVEIALLKGLKVPYIGAVLNKWGTVSVFERAEIAVEKSQNSPFLANSNPSFRVKMAIIFGLI